MAVNAKTCAIGVSEPSTERTHEQKLLHVLVNMSMSGYTGVEATLQSPSRHLELWGDSIHPAEWGASLLG